MKRVFLTILIMILGLAGSAQQAGDAVVQRPPAQRKVFAIHTEKRELRHEVRGKRHDYRERLHHRRTIKKLHRPLQHHHPKR
jgi:hypothetical protein